MALNADCLLLVLKRCSPEDVCNVSRTSKSANALINRHISILPRIHRSLTFSIDMDKKFIGCHPPKSEEMEHDGYPAICSWDYRRKPEDFVKHYRYVAFDDITVFPYGFRYNQLLLEKFFKDIEPLNAESIVLLHKYGDDFRVSQLHMEMAIEGLGPAQFQRIVKSAEGGFFYSSIRNRLRSGKHIDYSPLIDALCNANYSVLLYSNDCSSSIVVSFIENFLKEASRRKEKLASFVMMFMFSSASRSFAEDLIQKARQFAATDMVHSDEIFRYDQIIFKDSETTVHAVRCYFNNVFQLFHGSETLQLDFMKKLFKAR